MRVFFSMLKACICGAIIAFGAILVSNYVIYLLSNQTSAAEIAEEKLALIDTANSALIEEADQDPSFVSRFSRVFIYSADNGKEIIESAKNALPKNASAKVSAKSYVVIDLDRNVILMEKNPDKLLPMASITKLVTAVTAKRLLDKDEFITINSASLATYGNEARLRSGEKFKYEELLYPLLMVSSNDASEALARAYVKGRKSFLSEMNAWVNSIGAYRTYFADPSGLSPLNVSTAKDLSIITKWIMENEPEIFATTLLKSKTIRTHTWVNPTHFLNLSSYAGGKNGYTEEANRTSVALFKLGNQNKKYAVILLSSSNRDGDILDLLEEALR